MIDAMARGLESGHGGNHLMTIHPSLWSIPLQRSSSIEWGTSTWLDFNMLQTGHKVRGNPENYDQVAKDYALEPPKPAVEGEAQYEDTPDPPNDPSGPRSKDDAVRRKAYWGVFAGAAGHTYGHRDVEVFHEPGEPSAFQSRGYWKDSLQAAGAGQMRHLRALIESHSFFNRIPDQSILLSNPGSGIEHVSATRASNGNWSLIYIPTGGVVTINMSKISGTGVRASWLNPRDGIYTSIGNFTNTGSRIFDAPGATAAGNDWVLVMDSITTPAFDFSISNGGSRSVAQGQSVSNSISVSLVSGTSQSVSFSASGLPTGAAATFSPTSCSPACPTTLTISTLSTTPAGTYTITVTGNATGGLSKTTSFTLTVIGVDTSPPTVPTGLTATAVSSSQINLSWTTSTDNVGVAGYKVFRGGTQIATVTTGTSYFNTGLSPSTTY